MGGKKTAFIVFILTFFIFGGDLYARGAREDPVDRARTLIVEQRYNEALLILADTAKKDPDRLDEAETLIRRIRKLREGYNDKYEELIQVLYDQKDVRKALGIIDELEALDADPNKDTRLAIFRAKESALFVYNRELYDEIMERGAAQLAARDYWGAVETYLSGFSIGRESFDQADYGNIVTDGTNAALEAMRQASESFLQGRGAQTQALEGLLAAGGSDDPPGQAAALTDYQQAMRPAALLFKTAARSHTSLFERNRMVSTMRDGAREEDFFLGVSMRFAGGRRNAPSPEGLKGAAELLLKDASPFALQLREKSEAALAAGREFLQSQEADQAQLFFEEAQGAAAAAEQALRPWFEAIPPEEGPATPFVWNALKSEIPLFLGAETALRSSAGYIDLTEILKRMPRTGPPAAASAPELRAFRQNLRDNGELLDQLEAQWIEEGTVLQENPYSDEKVLHLTAQLQGDLSQWNNRFLAMETDVVNRLAGLELGVLNEGLASRTQEFRRAEELLLGMEQEVQISGGELEILHLQYPKESLEILRRLPEALDLLDGSTGDFVTLYENESPPIRDYPDLVAKRSQAEENRREIAALRASLVQREEQAREEVLLAERFKNEGNRRVSEAQSAIQRGDYDLAGEFIQAARQAFSTSLSHQEDPEFRRQSDARLLALDGDIIKALNNQIVLEVRGLLNEGKKLYEIKDFYQAERVLVQAQNRWKVTHIDDEPEVKRWLGYVRIALSVESNRVLLETDPLYPEINQLLNLARQDYSRGRDLMQRGARGEALAELTRAEEKIKQVTMTFPFNQEASVLLLQIAQLKDRDAFAAQFRLMFREASGKMRESPEESYRELLDLEQIDPNFPGLKAAIFENEIALNIRVRPPSRQAINESNVLFSRAAAIVNANDRAQFPIALEQLNRAIELNPDNRRATDLKDRVQIAVGGQTSVVLSSFAEDQYRNAERQFIAGNFFEALAIVERLLQNRESRNYPPLLELKRRIESRI